jgi:hypothetical protein
VEIPDLYLKLQSGEEIPQDPQAMRIQAAAGAEVLAETIDRGRRANLGPAIVRRSVGKGSVIYIASSLEAIYEETRMKRLRALFDTLLSPWLATQRSYEMEYRSGVMPHFMASRDSLVLHLLADTGHRKQEQAFAFARRVSAGDGCEGAHPRAAGAHGARGFVTARRDGGLGGGAQWLGRSHGAARIRA